MPIYMRVFSAPGTRVGENGNVRAFVRPTNVTVYGPAGNVVWLSLTGLRMVRRLCVNRFINNARLAIPREVDTAQVTHVAIPVDEMPAVSAYSMRPVVGI